LKSTTTLAYLRPKKVFSDLLGKRAGLGFRVFRV
jgi:hypothetical protein